MTTIVMQISVKGIHSVIAMATAALFTQDELRNLDQLFDPASVAVFGASQQPASVGARVWASARGGGFKGPVYAVNPKRRELDGQPVLARAADLPSVPELAVICTPPATVAGLIGAVCW